MRFLSSFMCVLLLVLGASKSHAQIVPPIGLQPGDQYRLIAPGPMLSHYTYTGASAERFYDANERAQAWADGLAVGQLGATWTAVFDFNTLGISAKDNTSSNPDSDGVGVPVYQTNGTRVADNYADLWDGTIQTGIRYGGNGEYRRDGGMYIRDDGSIARTGVTVNWFRSVTWHPTSAGPCYAMSSILTVPGGQPVNTAPTVSCPKVLECQCNEPSSRTVTLTAAIFDADGDELDVEWYVDGVLKRFVTASTAATDSFSYTFGLGASEVYVIVSDGTADPVSCSTVVTVVDTEDPVAVVGPDRVVETDPGECYATVVLEQPVVTDNCEIASVTNNAPANGLFLVGETVVTWTITDVGGNSITAQQLVTVEDREAPYLPMLDEIAVPHESGESDAFVELQTPDATDNCGVASITNDAPEHGRFPAGVTIVTWLATDEAGNETTTTQRVTVTNSDPVADVRVTGADVADELNKIYIECDGANGTSVSLDASASYDPDEGDTLTFTWAAAEGSGVVFSDDSATPTATFPMGATTVTLVVTDQCGAIGSTDAIIVIEDTTAPQIEIAYADKQVLWPVNHKMVPVAISVAVRDTCSNPEQLLVSCVASSNQPDDGSGDGSTVGDIDGLDGFLDDIAVEMVWNEETGLWEGMLDLRAERDGANGDRKYSFTCLVADASSNVTEATFCVLVPHDKKKK